MRLPFRGDIEGLRAVAILLVVAAHAGVPWLLGGFVGVDVFFVLSGYLITGLLVGEHRDTGRLDLRAFYARRLQRLLPALLLVVACTMAAAAILLAPFEQLEQLGAAAAAATWTSNLYFSFADLDYFGPGADRNLFLHTWSLGVEEQFYLLWPAWLLFLSGAWKRSPDVRRRPGAGFRGMAAILVASFALCVVLTRVAPAAAFYLVFPRAWQFALGALVFMCFDGPRGRWHDLAARAPLGWLGLGGIVGGAVLLDGSQPYPGTWSLLPSLGAAAVIASGTASQARGSAASLLATRPFQALGRRSYAWYLWHWPVLLLGATLVERPSLPSNLALAGLSLVLAAISYRLVEAPIRHSKRLRQRPAAVLAGSALAMAVMLSGSLALAAKARDWTQRDAQQRVLALRSDVPLIYAKGCDDWYRSSGVNACAFGAAQAPNTAVLIGDSIGAQWFPAIVQVFDRSDWRLLVITKSACPMVDEPYFYPRIGRRYTECEDWRNTALAFVRQAKPQIVMMGSSQSYPFSAEQLVAGTSRVLQTIPASSPVAVLMPTPLLPFNATECLARQAWHGGSLGFARECIAPADEAALSRHRKSLEIAVSTHPGAAVIDLNAAVCPGMTCAVEEDGVTRYRDERHLTASFVSTLAPALASALGKAGLPAPGGDATSPDVGL